MHQENRWVLSLFIGSFSRKSDTKMAILTTWRVSSNVASRLVLPDWWSEMAISNLEGLTSLKVHYNCSESEKLVKWLFGGLMTLTQITKTEFSSLTSVWPHVWVRQSATIPNLHLIVRIFCMTESVYDFCKIYFQKTGSILMLVPLWPPLLDSAFSK